MLSLVYFRFSAEHLMRPCRTEPRRPADVPPAAISRGNLLLQVPPESGGESLGMRQVVHGRDVWRGPPVDYWQHACVVSAARFSFARVQLAAGGRGLGVSAARWLSWKRDVIRRVCGLSDCRCVFVSQLLTLLQEHAPFKTTYYLFSSHNTNVHIVCCRRV